MRVRLGSGAGSERYLIDIVIETVCGCRDDGNDAVQLQVIKALLTAITCPTCVVREQSLLLAVRAVYHIFLVSRNAVNKNTAKATLRQMLTYVFQRMEAALVEGYRACDEQLLRVCAESQPPNDYSSCTSVTVVLSGEVLSCAHLGDSKIVLGREVGGVVVGKVRGACGGVGGSRGVQLQLLRAAAICVAPP